MWKVCLIAIAFIAVYIGIEHSCERYKAHMEQKQESKFIIVEMENEFGLSNDDFWCYIILENTMRLEIYINRNIQVDQAIQAIDIWIDYLKKIKEKQEFKDLYLYDRIDELIVQHREHKADLSQSEVIPDEQRIETLQQLLKYFRKCREEGQDFQSAVDNCYDRLSAPELG